MTLAVRAYDFANVLDAAPEGIKILSLDCFDTLLWRNCNLPVDVFADLPLPGSGMEARIWGEVKTRRVVGLQSSAEEVTIEQIYANMMPAASDAERQAAISNEIEAEVRHCYGFKPTVELMRNAKARDLQIIIVSDTYLSKEQLGDLIARAAGEDVRAMIDRIFCSCEYGKPKGLGLFVPVLAELGVPAESILHCGDNAIADVDAPSKLGINTCHLEQFDGETEQRLRMEASAACIVDPGTRIRVPAYQPHRQRIALRRSDDPAFRLGHDVLGPIFHSFAGWVHEEAAKQEAATGKPTKLLFLLRDGFLPAETFLARYPEAAGHVAKVEISRLTAARAGMIDRTAIERHVIPELAAGPIEVFTKHLMFDPSEAQRLARLPKARFAEHILKPEVVRNIAKRSGKFAEKLVAHLRLHGVADGDSVMLVDLGYNGSVQNLIEQRLKEMMNLTISGRYLLLRETSQSGLNKAGFADHNRYDFKLLHALSESIAIVEQLCTLPQGSVIDYQAIRSARPAASSPPRAPCAMWCSAAASISAAISTPASPNRRSATRPRHAAAWRPLRWRACCSCRSPAKWTCSATLITTSTWAQTNC
jgi:FMN phosphatase YigB (HAD superfamily)